LSPGLQAILLAFDYVDQDDSFRDVSGQVQGTKTFGLDGFVDYRYLLTDHIALSAEIAYQHAETTTYQQNVTGANIALPGSQDFVDFAPYVRYYFPAMSGTYLFVDGRFDFRRLVNTQAQLDLPTNSIVNPPAQVGYSYEASIVPGAVFFITEHVAGEISMAFLGVALARWSDGAGFTSHQGSNVQAHIYQNPGSFGLAYYW
jgi:hypothetical protein